MELAAKGYAYVSSSDATRGTWTIRYLMDGTIKQIDSGDLTVTARGERGEVLLSSKSGRRKIAKTVWHRGRHTAGGSGGTHLLATLLGKRDVFDFPKSVYAVRDCLQVAIGDRRDALIVDFFAGSGTTLHATALLNAEDGGQRRSILVTNNEVEEAVAVPLGKRGIFRGDPAFEAAGIFEAVTRPRVEAALSGRDPDGKAVPGTYIDGREYAAGFPENAEFFALQYADPDDIDLGKHDDALLPLVWLAAGAVGPRDRRRTTSWSMPAGAHYAVLFSEKHFRSFARELGRHPDVTHVWLVTESEATYSEMASRLPGRIRSSMLYRDYLRNFRVNVDQFA